MTCQTTFGTVDSKSLRASQTNGPAALAWTEAVTKIRDGHVPDEVYERVRRSFTERELANLTLAITVINGRNRINIALRTVAGTYQPTKSHAAARP